MKQYWDVIVRLVCAEGPPEYRLLLCQGESELEATMACWVEVSKILHRNRSYRHGYVYLVGPMDTLINHSVLRGEKQ